MLPRKNATELRSGEAPANLHVMANSSAVQRATNLIQDRGGVTPARVAIFAALLTAERPLSHQDLGAQLEARAIDRVTLYRVLDWLVQQDLAHRIVDADGVWHFAASVDKARFEHVHFHCQGCGRFYCLPDTPTPGARLPRGFIAKEKALVIDGFCAGCRA